MTATEAPLPFAPPVLDWLAARGCAHAQWSRDAAGADHASQDSFFHMGHLPGQAGGLGVQLAFRAGAGLSSGERAQLMHYLQAVMPFLVDDSPQAGRAAILTSTELLELEHRLRNHLNSMLMTAAALGLQCQPAQRADDYLDQMDAEVQRCLDLLRRLVGQAD